MMMDVSESTQLERQELVGRERVEEGCCSTV
jgi:hypothetical protein